MFDQMKDGSPAALNRNGASIQLLTFQVNDREYALNLANVVQIVRMVTKVSTPTPDSVEGMFNLRGRDIPVVDLRQKCGFPTKPFGLSTTLVITRSNNHVLALIVDAISHIFTVPLGSIELCDSALPEMAHVLAVGKQAGHALFILDPATLGTAA